jgi:WD40 repeat protein
VTNATKTVLSPDTRWLAVARSDFSVAVVDTDDGREVASFAGHTNDISSMSFNEEGNLLVTGSADGTARVWRIPSGEPVSPPLAHEGDVFHAVFRPGRQQLATVSTLASSRPRTRPGQIRIWDYVHGVQTLPSKEVTETLSVLFFHPHEGRRLFVGAGNALQIRDAETFEEVLPRFEMGSQAECWAFRPDGRALAVGCEDGTTHLWDLERGARLFPPFRHTSWTHSVSFSPDGSRLLATSNDGTAKVWDLPESPEIHPDWDPAEWMARSAVSGDGSTLAAIWPDLTVSVIDLETFRERTPRQPMLNSEADAQLPLDPYVAVDKTGRQWAAALRQSPWVGLWREEAGELKHIELPHPIPVDYFAFNEPGDRLITVGMDEGIIRVWHTSDGRLAHEAKIPGLDCRLLLFDQPGRRAAFTFQAPDGVVEAGKPKHGLQVLDLETGRPVSGIQWFHLQPQFIVFSPDANRIAVSESLAHILDAENLEFLHSFNHGGGWITQIWWSPDGQTVLTSGGVASDLKLWNATAGEPWFSSKPLGEPLVAPMRMSPSERLDAIFSADGRFVVATDDAHRIRVWDIATGEAVTPRWRKDARIELLNLTTRLRLNVISAHRPSAWDLKPIGLPSETIVDYATLLAGRRLGPGGALLPIPARELAELGQSLRARHPKLFLTPRAGRDE